jgi:copper chaperone CopZ
MTATDQSAKEHTMATLDLNVPTVHCTACKLNIEESLEEVPGVASSAVDLEAKRVTVEYDADAADPDSIKAAIEAAGYPVS